jgi:hypothetical protein
MSSATTNCLVHIFPKFMLDAGWEESGKPNLTMMFPTVDCVSIEFHYELEHPDEKISVRCQRIIGHHFGGQRRHFVMQFGKMR